MSTTPFRITYPPELPVSAMRDEIAEAIRDNQVVIVAGATGSGKTTQLPKICMELGRESIAHTQPRRLAARTIAERIADELDVELGSLVGYQVRFTDKASASTRIKLMTDGILLNELTRDRMLRRYDTIIIDEAHERSLTIDFLLGYLKQLLPKRPDLKVIVTSATIDPESFARHFAASDGTPAPVVEVSGRTYPVEIRYRPLVAESNGDDDEGASAEDLDLLGGIRAALADLDAEAPGDVLVFLSGENEIRDAQDALSDLRATEVLPLPATSPRATARPRRSSKSPGAPTRSRSAIGRSSPKATETTTRALPPRTSTFSAVSVRHSPTSTPKPPETCSSSFRARTRSATRRTRSPTCAPPKCFPSTGSCPQPINTACSSAAGPPACAAA